MAPIRYAPSLRDARLAVTRDAADGGLLILRNASLAVLVEIPLAAPSGTVADGVWTLAFQSPSGVAILAGTAVTAAILNAVDEVVANAMSVGLAGSGAAVILDTTTIAAGATVTISSAVVRHPGGAWAEGLPPLPLALDASTVLETAGADVLVGYLVGTRPGSNLALQDDAGGRFKLVGGAILTTGAVALDGNGRPIERIVVEETSGGVARQSPLDITVLAVFQGPTLVSVSPAAGSAAASRTGPTVYTFSEPVFPADYFYAGLWTYSGGDTPLQQWSTYGLPVGSGQGTTPGAYKFNGTTVSVYYMADLPAGEGFYRYLLGAGVVNAAGKAALDVSDEFATAAAPLIQGPSGVAGSTTSGKTIAETDSAPTLIHTFTASVLSTWSIVGGADAASFTITSASGNLQLIDVANYEAKSAYDVIVRATAEVGGATSDQALHLVLADVQEPGPHLSGVTFDDPTNALALAADAIGTAYVVAFPATGSVPSVGQIQALTGGSIYQGISYGVEAGANSDTFTPTPGVVPIGAYRIAILLVDGNGLPSNIAVVTATMEDEIAPTVSLSDPVDNATGVAPSKSIVITFSEAIAFGIAGSATLRQNNGGWSDAEIFDVATEQGTGNGQVSISGSALTLNPTVDMVPGREYAIRISAGALKDGSGNPFAGIANDTTLSFTIAAGGTPLVYVDQTADPRLIVSGSATAVSTWWGFVWTGQVPTPENSTSAVILEYSGGNTSINYNGTAKTVTLTMKGNTTSGGSANVTFMQAVYPFDPSAGVKQLVVMYDRATDLTSVYINGVLTAPASVATGAQITSGADTGKVQSGATALQSYAPNLRNFTLFDNTSGNRSLRASKIGQIVVTTTPFAIGAVWASGAPVYDLSGVTAQLKMGQAQVAADWNTPTNLGSGLSPAALSKSAAEVFANAP